MRILYLHPAGWTGEYVMLAKLAAMGEDVCALEEKRGLATGKRQLTDHYRDAGDGIRTLWYDPGRGWEKLLTWPFDRIFRRAFDGRNLVHRMWVIREAVGRFRPDVIVCSDGFTYAIPAAFLKRLDLLQPKLIVTYIGGDILECPEAAVGKRRTPMVSWLIQTSLGGIDIMRPLCESLAAILREEGADAYRIHILPMHLVVPREKLEAVRLKRAQIRDELRRRHALAPDAPVIVTLSGNQRGKGLHLLAAAWADVIRAVPAARWLMCGPDDPWLSEAVWPALRKAGVDSTVVYAGRLDADDVFRYLACGDVHVNPTMCEGLNVVSIEAAAVGTPTITSDGAGISDWLVRFDAGAVVPRLKVEPLADAIIGALRDPAKLERWGRHGPAMADEFLLERIAPAMLRLLQTT